VVSTLAPIKWWKKPVFKMCLANANLRRYIEDVFAAFATEAAARAVATAVLARDGAADVADIIGFGFIYS
jgi:hypothetical protein